MKTERVIKTQGGEMVVVVFADSEPADVLFLTSGQVRMSFGEYAELQKTVQEMRDQLATAIYYTPGKDLDG